MPIDHGERVTYLLESHFTIIAFHKKRSWCILLLKIAFLLDYIKQNNYFLIITIVARPRCRWKANGFAQVITIKTKVSLAEQNNNKS